MMKRPIRRGLPQCAQIPGRYFLTALLLASASALPAAAQTAGGAARPDASTSVDTVIVTAEKRAENVQDVPASVTAFSGAQLEQANIVSASDLARFIPSFSVFTANDNRNSTIVIRNLGTSGTNPGIEPDAGLYLDGVYLPAASAALADLQDISTVEVLRGPQGTLYGRNTAVGALNINTRAPTQATEAYADVSVGNFNSHRIAGYVGGGLTSDLAGRLTLYVDNHDGYEKNLFYNNYVNNADQYGGRGRLRWTPTQDTTVDAIAYFTRVSTVGTIPAQLNPLGPGGIATPGFLAASAAATPGHPFVPLGKFEVNEIDNPLDVTETWGGSINASRELPFGASVSNVLAYNAVDDHEYENDSAALPQLVARQPQHEDIRTTSDELRLTSTGHHFIDYVGGVYLFHEMLRFANDLTIQPGANRTFPGNAHLLVGDTSDFFYTQETNAGAAYGQATVNVTDAFRLFGGLRYSVDSKKASIVNVDFNATGVPASPTFIGSFPLENQPNLKRTDHSTTWTAGAQYDLTEGVMAYATAATGFKDGGFNARAAATGPFTFDPETVTSYEAGVKTSLFDHRLVFNADVYHMLLKAAQVSTLNPTTGVGFTVGNAGNVRVEGVEIDAHARPISELTLNASLSYADSVWDSYPKGQCIATFPTAGTPPPAGTPQPIAPGSSVCNYTGFTPAYSPKWRWSLGARWEQPWLKTEIDWFAAADVSYVSSQFEDATLDPRTFQDGYALVDASFGWQPPGGRWRVSVWGKNLANKSYNVAEFAQGLGAFVSAGGTAAANGFVGVYGVPRTFGVEASFRY
ncbi:TonB-dependent receptor [Phenylobacterium sp.]|jgi:iron complex outermembrane receptor protein|uniref:TonB-dependent receptor n=1 Tax=Phenylobacterium sp. TaxID=1871053 RepID=UPI002E371789|nr:TonB-dependent receptor [Phenylobacterium sp.]HEX3366229.1 TonB-dependent receptor [Phenylobacterium sp.]